MTHSMAWSSTAMISSSPHHPEYCQDMAVRALNQDGQHLLCVADGAGGSQYASFASRLATQIALRVFSENGPVPTDDADTLLGWMRKSIADCANTFEGALDRAGGTSADYWTTFAMAIVSGNWIGLASIGDSFVVLADHSDVGFQVLLPPDRPDGVASSAAYMLQDWVGHAIYRAYWSPSLYGLLLSTDGLEKFLVYRAVRDSDDRTVRKVWGVNRYISAVIEEHVKAGESVLEACLNDPRVRTSKGDDLGVALATRR